MARRYLLKSITAAAAAVLAWLRPDAHAPDVTAEEIVFYLRQHDEEMRRRYFSVNYSATTSSPVPYGSMGSIVDDGVWKKA